MTGTPLLTRFLLNGRNVPDCDSALMVRPRPASRRIVLLIWFGVMIVVLPVVLWEGLTGESDDQVGSVSSSNVDVWWALSWAAVVGGAVRALVLLFAVSRGETSKPQRAKAVGVGSAILAALGAIGLFILWLRP